MVSAEVQRDAFSEIEDLQVELLRKYMVELLSIYKPGCILNFSTAQPLNLLHSKSFQKLRIKISAAETFVLHQLKMKRNRCLYTLDHIFT